MCFYLTLTVLLPVQIDKARDARLGKVSEADPLSRVEKSLFIARWQLLR